MFAECYSVAERNRQRGTRDSDFLAEAHPGYAKAVEEENQLGEKRKATGVSKYFKRQSTTFELEHCWAILRNHRQFGGSSVPDNPAVEGGVVDNAVDLSESITSNPDQDRRFLDRPMQPKRPKFESTRENTRPQHSIELECFANAFEDGYRLFENSITMNGVRTMVIMAATDPHSFQCRCLLSLARKRFLHS